MARGHLLPSSNGRIYLGRLAAKALGNRGWVCFLGGFRRLSAHLGPHGHLPTCSRRTHQQHKQQADSNNGPATTVGYQSDHISAGETHVTCRRWHQTIVALILRWTWVALISGTACRDVGDLRRPRGGCFLFFSSLFLFGVSNEWAWVVFGKDMGWLGKRTDLHYRRFLCRPGFSTPLPFSFFFRPPSSHGDGRGPRAAAHLSHSGFLINLSPIPVHKLFGESEGNDLIRPDSGGAAAGLGPGQKRYPLDMFIFIFYTLLSDLVRRLKSVYYKLKRHYRFAARLGGLVTPAERY